MSNTKTVMGQAANHSCNIPLDITDVFSTYLYEGNGATQTITNDIDLAGEGGLVWQKNRTGSYSHSLVDTERGGQNTLQSNGTDAQVDRGSDFITSFNSDGFSIGADALINFNGYDFASWTFKKQTKFFDIVTYTGTGVAQNISHNLGTTPGCIIVKQTGGTTNWSVYHRSMDASAPESYYMALNLTNAKLGPGASQWNSTSPTDTQFTVGTGTNTNASGGTYVAYLFAHNDGDGEFGPDGDQDIIKCGSFSGETTINLGWEPQWVMVKRTDSSSNGEWLISDNMRGWVTAGGRERFLAANSSDREGQDSGDGIYSNSDSWEPTSTGFKTFGFPFSSSGTYIYMAIRRGPLAPPESGTEVFNVDYQGTNGSVSYSPFAADFLLDGYRNGNSANARARPRLTGGFMTTSSNAAELDAGATGFDQMDGWRTAGSVNSTVISWVWKRAPGFFDVVAYTGNDTPRTLPHNLGAAPEMIITKSRTGTGSWWTYHSGLNVNGDGRPETDYVMLNSTQEARDFNVWNDTAPTDTVFSLGSFSGNNETGTNYIAYLFATLPGVSKVGSFSHTYGGTTNVDCGFTSGARFVLWKRTDGTRHWEVFDTARGIVAGNDAYLRLSDTIAETSGDYIDPYSAGFSIGSALGTGDFIFYAIA